jgi:ataxin-3
MQPYHDRPQYANDNPSPSVTNTSHRDQRAFILNCEQHWFTLRRFGDSENLGPWFNLDSSLDRPEWVSETYLGVLLQQAEADGNTLCGSPSYEIEAQHWLWL